MLTVMLSGCASYTIRVGPQLEKTPAPTVTIQSSPASIVAGISSKLTITSSNATSVSVSGSDGSNYPLPGNGGSLVVLPTVTTTYTATATNASGTATAQTIVAVATPSPALTISATPASIVAGTSCTVTVTATNASKVTLSGTDGSSYNLPAAGGKQAVSPSTTTTYTATAVGSGGQSTVSTILPVSPAPTVTIAADPASITSGQSTTLTVAAANATTVTIAGSDGSTYALKPTGGAEIVDPSATTTYTATASNGTVSAIAKALITVNAAGPAAYVYVRTSDLTIAAFSAAHDGTLTQIQSLPMAGDKLLAANNHSVFTANSTSGEVDTYSIQPDGSLSGPIGSVNTQEYGGARCGLPSGQAVIDGGGQYLSVELRSPQGIQDIEPCATWQTYKVQSGGSYVFEGYDDSDPWSQPGPDSGTLPLNISAVSGNNQFAYGIVKTNTKSFLTMTQRDTTGSLHLIQNFGEVDPQPDAPGDTYFPEYVAADGSNHLAVGLSISTTNPALHGKHWLASYTIANSTGAIQSTNAYTNLAEVDLQGPWPIAISPSGDLVAVGSTSGDGFQIFHFNGANPPTRDGPAVDPGISPSVVQLAWDNQHHLYVLGQTIVNPWQVPQGLLYVYTVSNSGVTQVAGSPWTLPNSSRLVVVAKN